MNTGPARSAVLAAAALAAVAAACSGSGGDKAGGSKEKPLVFTLESEDDLTVSGAPEFAEAVERLSGGAMRIQFDPARRSAEIDFERGVVEDVRSGKTQLGIVGVRVWDTIGVSSFQALLAPLLVDSYELERRVLESPLADRMLEGVEEAGVVGVALLPGPLRRPFGLSRALLAPRDYRGATIGIRPAGVAATTFRALGAAPKGYVSGSLSGLDAVEIDPHLIDYNDWQGVLTTNVVLWPKPFSIVMNRKAFERLTPEQREVLRSAGREALAPELRQIVRDGAEGLVEACEQGLISVASASAADVAALREAVQPVYDELERDPETKELLAAIRALRDDRTASEPSRPRCRRDARGGVKTSTSAIEGLWETTWTRDELIAAGLPPKDAEAFHGHHTAEFASGRFTFQQDPGSGKSSSGTYTLDGDVIRLVFETGIGLQLGRQYELRWNRYRDSLRFSAPPRGEVLQAFLTEPYTRVR